MNLNNSSNNIESVQYYPLTHPQKVVWYTEKVYPGTSIGNVAGTLRIKGKIDYSILERAINIFIEKNEGMRIRIRENHDEPQQYISEYKYQKIDFYDFSGKDINEFYKFNQHITQIPFELVDSDLYYFAIIKINEEDGGFYTKNHHLISDAWNMSLLGSQIVEYYSKLKHGLEISKENNPSYFEYITSEDEYKKSIRFQKDKEYWNKKFESIIDPTSLKSKTSKYMGIKARRKTLIVPKKLSAKMQQYCSENKTSAFSLFTAALAMYVNRITSKENIILGTTTLNRTNAREKETIGMFSSVASILIDISHDMSFKTLTENLTKNNMALLRHQKYPYDLLLKDIRETHKTSDNLFDIVLNYQNSKFNKNEVEEYSTRWHFNGHQVESLSININDREDEGHLIIDYDYLSEIFHVKEIEFIHQHIINLLWHALDNPSKKISKLDMLSEKEKHKILFDFNNTKAEYPKDKTIHQMFEEQVERTPDNVAVIFKNEKLTYRELNNKANQAARLLREKGVKQDSIVVIMVYRSLEMIIGIMGILKAGGAYLPIDPEYPKDRIQYMLEDSGTKLLLTETALQGRVKFKGEIIDLKDKGVYSGEIEKLQNINTPQNLAYIIYTSGSTGKPKGVMIEHQGVVNRINWMQKKYPLDENSVILQKTPFTFDVSVWELFWWSFVGAGVCMLEPGGEKEPEKIIKAVENYKITTMHFVPSMLNIFLKYIEEQNKLERLSSLKQVFASGEALTPQKANLFNRLLNKVNGTELYNLYGPTEATVDVSYFDCSVGKELESVPIGKPIDNTCLYILDKNNNLQPIGIPGELCIGGDQVARGYINKPELTFEKFVPNPFIPGTKMYKTGDLARWFPKGDIEYLGRFDFQVKIRGNRIEIGEIENRLHEHRNIKDAVVIAREDKGENKYLCAYIVCSEYVEISELKEHLLKKLPDYMIPSYFVKLDEMPLSSNGKANRNALPEPQKNAQAEIEYIAPSNEVEEMLVKICSEVLKIEKLGVNDNLFNLGGDSIRIIEILTNIYKYKWGLTVEDFYKYQTIKKLSDKIKGTINCMSEANSLDIAAFEAKEEAVGIFEKEKIDNIFLTGATGFLGIHILDELIKDTEANIYCLIRGESKASAENRLKKLLEFYFKGDYDSLISKRIFVLNGDITLEKFGLSEKEYDELGKITDSVIHSAAIVKYYGDYSQIEKVNVLGTKRVVDFALTYGKKMNHISTDAVTGNYLVNNNIGSITFTENDFYVGQNYTENIYVRSKFEAENIVFKSIKYGLNATIYRMGNLSGRYSDGHFQPNISENAFYSTMKSIIELGAVSTKLINEEVDFTPIDFSSRAILKILKTKESSGRVFHIFDHKKTKIKNMVEMIRKTGIKIKVLDEEKYNEYIENKAKQNMLSGLVIYLDETGELAYKSLINVDSKISQKYLAKLGFEWPEINEEYIKKLIDYIKKEKYI